MYYRGVMAGQIGHGIMEEELWRKGPWTAEEDRLLIEYVRVHGEGRWNSVARLAALKYVITFNCFIFSNFSLCRICQCCVMCFVYGGLNDHINSESLKFIYYSRIEKEWKELQIEMGELSKARS
ncbi:myb family transcription factor family protein, partial [Trifolium medium]|nr:myb family transcription factor family protein [Trifolium medium]